MTSQHNEPGRSGQSITNPKANGGGEKKSSAGERANNNQAPPMESYPEAIQRWIQESDDVAPWIAIGVSQDAALAKKGGEREEATSMSGATAGFEAFVSKK